MDLVLVTAMESRPYLEKLLLPRSADHMAIVRAICEKSV